MKKYHVKRVLLTGLAAALFFGGDGHVQAAPSPLVEYASVRDAWAVVGLPVYTPTLLPVGYVQKDIIVIDNRLAEIFYRNEAGKEILFRMAKGDSDISGNNNVYEVNKVVQVGRQYIRVKGTEKRVSLALWARNGYTFSISFEEPVSVEAVQAIVDTIPWQ
ncbi:DUF4367 domain-containing protein [Selenomonas sp. F0473]|uniref:DUF4367 domain-containing protein n=1 Tax=Selenomonas sp. F0473 TaxID=999423 RepID=UPI00029E92CF|nr:DUF4367 domain-containing protein [Selenomonas sp. F0473]EKU71533.1 hypothetical protein HMPREF9161_00218 [Selenomonas sp. F0473]